jgi:hypothetical protein
LCFGYHSIIINPFEYHSVSVVNDLIINIYMNIMIQIENALDVSCVIITIKININT